MEITSHFKEIHGVPYGLDTISVCPMFNNWKSINLDCPTSIGNYLNNPLYIGAFFNLILSDMNL